MELIIRDPELIVPIRPIPQKEIDQVNQWHEELFGETGLDRALFIGEHLLWWKDLIPHGKWELWRKQTFPKITNDMAFRYMRLGKNREIILERNSKLAEMPLLNACQALEFIAEKNAKSKGKSRKVRISKTILEKLLVLWEKLDSRDRKTFLEKVSE